MLGGMELVLLTQSSTFIIGDIAKLLGFIMNGLFKITGSIGIQNIGLCIILFTIVVKLLMLPLTIKQMRFSKFSTIMNPEIQAIQAKYKGKTDNESMMKMREETNAVYEKYGTSATGGCLQLFIQLPIIYALYRVVQNIPAYVPSVKVYFENIINAAPADFGQILSENITGNSRLGKFDFLSGPNGIIDALNVFTPEQWEKLKELFPSMGRVIAENLEQINSMNNFFGINLAANPGIAFPAILIPILAAFTQWLSIKMMSSKNQPQMSEDNPMASTMQSMNVMMPIMSGIIAISLPAALGLYWITQAVCQIVQQFFINRYFDKADIEELIKKNVENANKKRAKKGLPPNSISNKALVNAKKLENAQSNLEEIRRSNMEKAQQEMKKAKDYYNKEGGNSSIAQRANMVAKFNEKNK